MLRKSLPYLLLLPLAALYFSGLGAIPFHPDEATLIYTSQDFETLFRDPLSLAWEPGQELEGLARYRVLDEPLSRLVFGLARVISGTPQDAVNRDWDWSETWEANLGAGALPDRALLIAARATITFFTFLSVFLLVRITDKSGGLAAALVVLVFFGLNALVLLHGRRAMRDGLMLFGISLVLWILPRASTKPWAAGLAAALAMAARYSLAPLVPVALLAAVWDPLRARDLRRAANRGLQFTAAFAALFMLLHPVLWKHPVEGLQRMAASRIEFTRTGVETLAAAAPDLVMASWQTRAGVLLYHTFLSPLAYYDIGNYAEALAPAGAAYDAKPLLGLWHGPAGGGIFLFLVITGAVIVLYRLIRRLPVPQPMLGLLAIGLSLQAGFILATIPFPVQRYYLPLLPFLALMGAAPFIFPRYAASKNRSDSD